jgi:3-deoxy-7-phosphoheptulonate synthase
MKEHIVLNETDRQMNKLLTPQLARQQAPLTPALEERIAEQRDTVIRILRGEDKRMLAIVGPCSIHDPVSALEYAEKLSKLSNQLKNELVILMRVYVQKPRTELGWQGYLLDPAMDGSGDANTGIVATRELMKAVVSLGLGVATEYVSPTAEAYLGDLVSWAAIGARSVESQLHRNFISGLSIPVGCKNSRQGSVDAAISTLVAGSGQQQYLGVNNDGQVDLIRTAGNPNCHVVLRGGASGPNYDEFNLVRVQDKLQRKDVLPAVVVDCSHDNSGRDYRQQSTVAKSVLQSLQNPKLNVRGIMLESNLVEGKQKLRDPAQLVYGQSVTDCCMGWPETDELLRMLAMEKGDEE